MTTPGFSWCPPRSSNSLWFNISMAKWHLQASHVSSQVSKHRNILLVVLLALSDTQSFESSVTSCRTLEDTKTSFHSWTFTLIHLKSEMKVSVFLHVRGPRRYPWCLNNTAPLCTTSALRKLRSKTLSLWHGCALKWDSSPKQNRGLGRQHSWYRAQSTT